MICLDHILSMSRDKVQNYIAPGLSSSIIGAKHEGGCVRLFHSSRDQQFAVTPHSHRFNFLCQVLSGSVVNRVWTSGFGISPDTRGDDFVMTELHFDKMGAYTRGLAKAVRMRPTDKEYAAGKSYSMRAEEIHSIYFRANTYVLFFEGPTQTEESVILEPLVDGKLIPTFEVSPWMFRAGSPAVVKA